MDHEFRFTAEKIGSRIKLVRRHRFVQQKELRAFRLDDPDSQTPNSAGSFDLDALPEIAPGSYWGGVNFRFRLLSQFEIPHDWLHPALCLPLGDIGDVFNHPEALVMVDGKPLGSVDRHHHAILLGPATEGLHELVLEGWSGWSDYPPDFGSTKQLQMCNCYTVETNPELESFLILAECALETAQLLDTGGTERSRILDVLDQAFLVLDTRDPIGQAMHASAADALECLQTGLGQAGAPLDAELLGIGHAHMDIGYLWSVAETRRKCARTMSNVLGLMDRHPEFCFSHSQPATYAMAEEDHPDIFTRLRSHVDEGRWEPVGGMWVEADCNLPGGEALVRQIMLGRRWFADRFGSGAETPVLWLPDTFGFCWCLPQLMKLSGLEMMVTNKPNWNQHNRLPASTFQWQGMDGSRVPVHVLTTPREVDHLPFPTNYKSDLSGIEVKGTFTNAIDTRLQPLPICFGFGDGGGGPTEELIKRAEAFGCMPSMPRLRMGRVSELLKAVEEIADDLPVINDEIYVEGHRGVLTSQGWIKRANRLAEAALHRAELLCVLSGAGTMPGRLNEAWQILCLNQFHDILTGSCIADVMDQARHDFAEIFDICAEFESAALAKLGPGEIGVLNPGPTPRHCVALIEGPAPDDAVSQETEEGTLVGLPPLPGYGGAKLADGTPPGELSIQRQDGRIVMQNRWLRAEFSPEGGLEKLTDIDAGRELLAEGERGNQLWAFEDRPLSWDAWDIDPFFEDRSEEISGIDSLEITETGPLRVELKITRSYRNSRLVQHVRLTDRSPRLDFFTVIDWKERHVLLKAAFPVSVYSPKAACGQQWGKIDRPTTRNTRQEASKFEVCAHKWMAVHDGNYAVALLDDCKYGHDARGNVLRLTLLKSATWPDPDSDRCRHEFTYSIMGQEGAGFTGIRAEAEAMNHPVVVAPGLGEIVPPVAIDLPNILVETVKPPETGNGHILRLYESEGIKSTPVLTFPHDMHAVHVTDLHENEIEQCNLDGRQLALDLGPFQIITIRVQPSPGRSANPHLFFRSPAVSHEGALGGAEANALAHDGVWPRRERHFLR